MFTVILGGAAVVVMGLAWLQLPAVGAGGLLYAGRRPVALPPPNGCVDVRLNGADVELRGWRCDAPVQMHRGTVIFLHGRADNRTSSRGVIGRYLPRGLTVIAYDSRGHGEAGGDACTYGYYEKKDLRAVVDTAAPGPLVLIGTSLGAAVALQFAAEDRRVSAVVAAETFSDLHTIATERAPFVFTPALINRAFVLAETRARFDARAVSPVRAARHIEAPVLLTHGARDVHTHPEHSRRVYDALRGPKRLMLVPDARHNESLAGPVWNDIDALVEQVSGARQ